MNKKIQITIFLLRLVLGMIFLYAGISKLIDPAWTAAGFLNNAKSLSGFYSWLAEPSNIVWVNFMNKWGLTLIGTSIFFGALTKIGSFFGIIMMILYYIPALSFPFVGANGYIFDSHVVYMLVFLLFIFSDAGKYLGLDQIIFEKISRRK